MDCLTLKKSNCKNCYKCIRHCPVKSIRFSGNQAYIIGNECILCGQCFVVCPQDAKQIVDETEKVKVLLQSSDPVIVSLAPSFIANYEGVGINAMREALKKLSFFDAEETAVGATIVKTEYEHMIDSDTRDIIISSCCLIAFALLFPFLLDPAVVGQRNFATNLLFLCIGFALMGTAFGPIGAFLPELFDANVRYSGSGIGYNLAAIVGAAFVPTIATWLSHHWGVHSVGLYLGVMALCCLIAVLSCKETKNVDFTK